MYNGLIQSVSLKLKSYTNNIEQHHHDFLQIVLPQSGLMKIDVGGARDRIDCDQGVIIPTGVQHSFVAQPKHQFLVMDVMEAIPGSLTSLLRENLFFSFKSELQHLVRYAASNLESLLNSSQMTDSWTLLFFSSLTHPSRKSLSIKKIALYKALSFIKNHLGSSITSYDIAFAAGVSERQLYIIFQEELKKTPYRYLCDIRLNIAIDLLRKTDLSIAEIAYQTGHADQSTLTHIFKKIKGTSPSKFRKSVRR